MDHYWIIIGAKDSPQDHSRPPKTTQDHPRPLKPPSQAFTTTSGIWPKLRPSSPPPFPVTHLYNTERAVVPLSGPTVGELSCLQQCQPFRQKWVMGKYTVNTWRLLRKIKTCQISLVSTPDTCRYRLIRGVSGGSYTLFLPCEKSPQQHDSDLTEIRQ